MPLGVEPPSLLAADELTAWIGHTDIVPEGAGIVNRKALLENVGILLSIVSLFPWLPVRAALTFLGAFASYWREVGGGSK